MALGNFTPSITSLPAGQGSSVPSDFVNNLQSRLVVQSKDSFSIGGFKFDYDGEARVEEHTDVTDHFAEDNTAIEDHAADKPTRLSLRGVVAELAITASEIAGLLGGLQTALTTVPAYLQKYTPGAVQTLSKAVSQAQAIQNQVNQAIAQGQSVLSLFGPSVPATTKQQAVYAQLRALRSTHQLLTVMTPFDVFKNMIIEDLIMTQPEDTKTWSEVTVVLKQMRFVDVIEVPNYLSKFGGRAALQNQATTNIGRQAGTSVPTSVLYSAFVGK